MLPRSLLAMVLISAVGCQTPPRINRHIELLNAEKRELEDQLYELEYELEDAQQQLDLLKAENAALRERSGVPVSPLPAARSKPRPAERAPRTKDSSSSPDFAPPMIDEGMLTEPKVEIPDDGSAQTPPAANPVAAVPPTPPELARDSGNRQAGALLTAAPTLEPADPRITHIYLNPLLTGGSDFDRQPGDDGLTVAIEPRNSDNSFVPLAGPISIVLLDPSLDEDKGRIARWDLDAKDTQQAIQSGGAARGIQLRLPWPNTAPATNRLQVFVRYVTVDGRKLDASREIFITLPGQFSQRWTPRAGSVTGPSQSASNDPPAGDSIDPLPKDITTVTPDSAVQPASHTTDVSGPSGEADSIPASVPPTPPWQPIR